MCWRGGGNYMTHCGGIDRMIVGLQRTAKLSKQTWRDVASACVPD